MPHFPGHRPSRLQGLLDKGQGRGLFGPNIRQGGVALGPGRNTLIGPNPAAANAMGSAINRFAAPGPSAPTSPRVMNTGGAKVSDIFKNAQMGQFGSRPAVQSPLAGYGQFGPQAQQVQQVQGVQGGPDVNALAAGVGQRLAGTPDAGVPATGFEEMYGATGSGPGAEGAAQEGPQGFMGKVGGFFNRTIGDKGSGKRSDIGRSMMQAGAAMMKGSPDGTFATIGQGLEAGLGAYEGLKGQRLLRDDREEEKRIRDEDRARRIAAEDLETSQDAARREAYGGIFPVDEETGERGEFNMEAWRDSFATALEQGDTQFAGVLMQMRPEDPEEIPLGDWKEANGARRDESGAWRKVFYRTGADGTVETQLSEYTVEPPAGARAGGTGGAGEGITKDEQTGNAAIEAIGHLVDTGGWMALTGMVRDTDEFRRLRGEVLLENPDATATQIMEYTRDAWSDAEGLMPERWWEPDSWGEGLGDEASMLLMAVLQDTSGQGGEGDWLITKAIKNKGREWAQRNEHAVAFATAQAQALQAINPMVRYLSGAQMTNAEAMRYYGALIPTWGDAPEVANAKMRGLTVMAKAMRGDSEAREIVDMTGFEDDDRLTKEDNLERRNQWARTQINQVMQDELGRIEISASQAEREEDVAAAQARADDDAAMAASIAAQNAPITGAAAMDYALRGRPTQNQPMFNPRRVGPR